MRSMDYNYRLRFSIQDPRVDEIGHVIVNENKDIFVQVEYKHVRIHHAREINESTWRTSGIITDSGFNVT